MDACSLRDLKSDNSISITLQSEIDIHTFYLNKCFNTLSPALNSHSTASYRLN